jgi:hypothetical protein
MRWRPSTPQAPATTDRGLPPPLTAADAEAGVIAGHRRAADARAERAGARQHLRAGLALSHVINGQMTIGHAMDVIARRGASVNASCDGARQARRGAGKKRG